MQISQLSFRRSVVPFLRGTLIDIVAGVLYAAGVYTFAAKADFVPGGVSGLAIIVNTFTRLPIGLCILLINVPIILYCLKTLGKPFLLRSLRTMVISTVIMDYVIPHVPAYTGDKLMAALFAGALSGLGLALIYREGSSTGGSDFLILAWRKKRPHLSIGMITTVIDGAVILLGGALLGEIDAVLQGLVMMAVSTTVIDRTTAGFTAGQMVFVITGQGERVAGRIMEEIGRGVTALEGVGMYSGTGKKVLVCACSRAEACRIRAIAYRADPSALTILCPYETAYGLGFQPPEA